jgi:hypothetical protein
MKTIKTISIILSFLIILPIIFTACQSDNSDIKGAFELSDEEWNILKDAEVSEKQKIVKFYLYAPRLHKPFCESTKDFDEMERGTIYLDTDKQKAYTIYNDVASDQISSHIPIHFMNVYNKCVNNIELLFSSTKATKKFVSDLEIYKVEFYHHGNLGVFAVYDTNCGEFIYMNQYCWGYSVNVEYKEYLLPLEKYTEVAKQLNDIPNDNSWDLIRHYPDAGELVDLSEYEVKRYENVAIIAGISVAVVCVGGICGYVVYKKRKTKSLSGEPNE